GLEVEKARFEGLLSLVAHAPSEHLAPQFGFIPGRSTMQPMFILRHLVHAQKANVDAKHRKLFTAFIDFKQAYDHIPRQQLWEHLRVGVKLPQPLLACLEGLYRDDSYVLIDGPHRTPPVTPDQGVKQGCPISPLLFALYVHDISKEFLGLVDAVRVQGTPVTHFMYADDLTLVSTSPHGLQRLVCQLQGFADRKHLTVNVGKSKHLLTALLPDMPPVKKKKANRANWAKAQAQYEAAKSMELVIPSCSAVCVRLQEARGMEVSSQHHSGQRSWQYWAHQRAGLSSTAPNPAPSSSNSRGGNSKSSSNNRGGGGRHQAGSIFSHSAMISSMDARIGSMDAMIGSMDAMIGSINNKLDPGALARRLANIDLPDFEARLLTLRKQKRDKETTTADDNREAKAARKTEESACMVDGNAKMVLNVLTQAPLQQLQQAFQQHARGADYSNTSAKEATRFTREQLRAYLLYHKVPPRDQPVGNTLVAGWQKAVQKHIAERGSPTGHGDTAKLSQSDLLMRVIKAGVELGRSCQASWSAQFQLAARELMGGEFTLSPDMVLGTKAMKVKWLER
ncbi:hypothetical protein QJQ45_024524, partial [Haematococcus lacustris]